MKLEPPVPLVLRLALLGAAALGSGCASLCPIAVTPESIARDVRPGDTVRIDTRARRKLRLLVRSVEEAEIRGRRTRGPGHAVWVGFNAIDEIEVECESTGNESPLGSTD